MMLSEFLKEERKQAINREWTYLSPVQRFVIFSYFALGILPGFILRSWTAYLKRKQAAYAYNYPAHWVGV